MKTIIKLIAITDWCLITFGLLSFIGLLGGRIAYQLEKELIGWAELEKDCYWYEVFSWVFYIAFSLLISAAIVRFVLFLITKIIKI